MQRSKFLIFLLTISLLYPCISSGDPLAQPTGYPRTANIFLRAGKDLTPPLYETLSSFDLLVLPMEAQMYNRDFFAYARKKNPTIKILPYIPSRSINITDIEDGAGLRKTLKNGILNEWYLRDLAGNPIQSWPGTLPLNVTTPWQSYLVNFVKSKILSSGLWDGVYFDEWDDDISHLVTDSDLNTDGRADTPQERQEIWQNANEALLKETRQRIGDHALILINGSSLKRYEPYINGRVFENFPTPWHGTGQWIDSMHSYLGEERFVRFPASFLLIGAQRDVTGSALYQRMRYLLTSTLLGNGYFGFDSGEQDHGQLWRYDEYTVALGLPTSDAYRIDPSMELFIQNGLWRRNFQHGIVLVNSTDSKQTIDLGDTYEKILGQTDTTVNTGDRVSFITLAAHSGIILKNTLPDSFFASLPAGTVNFLDSDGHTTRMQYKNIQTGNDRIITRITDDIIGHDGKKETIESANGRITIRSSVGKLLRSFDPYGKTFRGTIQVAIRREGTVPTIVTSPVNKRDMHIRVFTVDGMALNPGFHKKITSSTNYLRARDSDHDGIDEILVIEK